MGVVLYKIGTKYEIDGWKCDKQTFEPEFLNWKARFAEGWHLTPDCGRKKENGVQQEKRDEEKPKEPEEKTELSKVEVVENYLDEYRIIEEGRKKLEKLTYPQMRSLAKKKGLNSHAMNKKKLKDFLLKELYTGVVKNDVQNRSDQQCVQSASNQRSDDDKPVTRGNLLSP